MTANSLHAIFQSPYKAAHSTEIIALLCVKNDILSAVDNTLGVLALIDLKCSF